MWMSPKNIQIHSILWNSEIYNSLWMLLIWINVWRYAQRSLKKSSVIYPQILIRLDYEWSKFSDFDHSLEIPVAIHPDKEIIYLAIYFKVSYRLKQVGLEKSRTKKKFNLSHAPKMTKQKTKNLKILVGNKIYWAEILVISQKFSQFRPTFFTNSLPIRYFPNNRGGEGLIKFSDCRWQSQKYLKFLRCYFHSDCLNEGWNIC